MAEALIIKPDSNLRRVVQGRLPFSTELAARFEGTDGSAPISRIRLAEDLAWGEARECFFFVESLVRQ